MSKIIDSHHHFWDVKRDSHAWLSADALKPINRSFLPEDLKPLIQGVGVDATIFVQVQHTLEENRWVLKLAEDNPFIAGMVGWVDLASPDVESQVLEFAPHPKFVGVRHITHNEPDDDFIVRPEILRGLKVLEKHQMPFDLLFFVKHLHHTVTLAKMFPNLPMVIDHLAKPEIKLHRLDNWEANFRAAAKFPNVHCKLSGMVTEADWANWKPSDLTPYVQIALECFGPSRCMFGSDWPVCELAGSYDRVFHALNEALGPISASEREAIFGGTATKFYGLDV